MRPILAIDPGNVCSAWVNYDADAKAPIRFGYVPNGEMRHLLKVNAFCRLTWRNSAAEPPFGEAPHYLAIEMIASYGMAVGREVFDTCVWIGRFMESWDQSETVTQMFRMRVKQHLCHDSRAKDSNIRQALLDRFGGRDAAIGKKKLPGPLYGMSGDVWAALAVAITHAEASEVSAPALRGFGAARGIL